MNPASAAGVALALLATGPLALAQSFAYPNFSSTSGLTLNGAATPTGSVINVTNNGANQVGSFFYSTAVPVAEGFDTTFQFFMTSSTEGMAFVVHNSPQGASALGGDLWGLGYGFGNTTNPIANSLVIEIDAAQDSFLNDTSANEVSVHTTGTLGNSENEGVSIARFSPAGDLSNAQPHTMRVNYVPGVLEIYVDNLGAPLLTVPYTFEDGGTQLSGGATGGLDLPTGEAWVGFTSSTPFGATNQRAELRSWNWVSQQSPDDCYVGNAGSTAGGPYDLLAISGSTGGFFRTVRLAVADPFSFDIDVPPGQSTAPFVLLGWLGVADALTVTPTIYGSACFPPIAPIDIGSFVAPYSAQIPPGIALNLEFTFQVVMATDAGNPSVIELTNAVALDFDPAPGPLITNVTPLSAPVGNTVTVNGDNFSPFATVIINGQTLQPIAAADAQLTFAMPAGVPCGSSVTVRNPDGAIATVPFNPTPTITNQISTQGTSLGGVSFIVLGTGFAPGTTVTIGGNPANVTSASATLVVATTPPGTPGPTQVVITTPGGCIVTTNYTYL
ncbi:MAG: IPT/TIG domain-containing protein [Planctomycetota bacterium]